MTLHIPIALREATPADAPALARLIDIAGEGVPNWLWTQMADGGQTRSRSARNARAATPAASPGATRWSPSATARWRR
jgi:hypothetical protein